MKRVGLFMLGFLLSFQVLAQTNPALSMSEILAYNARFNPSDNRQAEILKDLKPEFLINNLKTDNEKVAFWVNVYNSFMLILLRDTVYEGVYTNFYKTKNVAIAGKTFSLFDIEHEFIRLGKKDKALGFKKSKINKDTIWKKLRPHEFDIRVVWLMYRGLYGYPPFQVIENADVGTAFDNSTLYLAETLGQPDKVYSWLKPYLLSSKKNKWTFNFIPFAVHINNFYPKYKGTTFKDEEKNPWLK